MRVAVVGCAHGELDFIYAAIREAERARNLTVDLVICAGDFQAVRNYADLQCMSCPPKFRDMRTFWKYYAGKCVAPVPTIFVGGNHEASNYMQEMPLGGIVAPNMYFLGNAGVISYRGLRIAGLSGVYTEHNYEKMRTETPPYPRNQIKSVYHARKVDVDRLMRLKQAPHVFVSHDWPRGITDYGDLDALLSAKPFLRVEIEEGSFGNPGAAELLHSLQPKYWFAAHMHVKFPAMVVHTDTAKTTRFLALDKVLPKREFVQILDIPVDMLDYTSPVEFEDRKSLMEERPEYRIDLDAEWLAILHTESRETQRRTPVTETEMKSVVDALRAKEVRSYVRPVSDFEKVGPEHDPNQKKLATPTSIDIHPNTLRLLDALQLREEDWVPRQQSVVNEASHLQSAQ